MINSKITKSAATQLSTEDKVLKFLEGIDWKLWEIYKMLKDQTEAAEVQDKK
jgi:hypothetical protein